MRTEELRVRDPYVVVYNDTYYMYRSGENSSIFVHKSSDLKEWDEGTVVYTLSKDSWGIKDLWAPEVHLYKGKYYMFLSLLGKSGLRGTEISVCDTPEGMFTPLTNKSATPEERSCIDGTLYVEDGVPYIVYSADWPFNYVKERDCYVGEIWAQRLTEDLTERVGDAFLLFKSDEAPCSKIPNICNYEGKDVTRYGSDAPFLQKLSDGTLYLTWSPYPDKTYIVAAAISENGSIKGKWTHLDKPLFDGHGGHAMFFKDLDGKLKMCIHCPERPPFERALFLDVCEDGKKLKICK